MEPEVKAALEALTKLAKEGNYNPKGLRAPKSSLHSIIKTPEQAERFMRMLKAALEEKK
jgi:hypothetical protein